MSDVNIKATLSVDSGNSAKSINDLKSEIVESKKAMESAAIGSDAFQKAQAELSARQNELIQSTKNATSANTGLTKTFDKLAANLTPTINNLKALKLQLKDTAVGSKEFDELSAQIRDMDDAISDAKATNDDFLGQLENAPGVLGMLGKGIRGTERTFSSFSGALKASGIGLIVALLGGLAAAFSENEGAMKKLQPLLDGVSKIFQGVFRAVEPLFNTMVDLAMKALPMVTKGIGMVYSAMMGYFTFLKESGTGALKILKGVFTLDTNTIKEGMNQIGGSFKKTAQSYNESMKRFSDGSKELTANEKQSAEERKAIRDQEIADRIAKDEKEKARREKLAKEEKDRFNARKKEIDAYNEVEAGIQAEKDIIKADKEAKKNVIDFSKGMEILQAKKALTDEELADAKLKAEQEIQIEKEKVASKQQALSDIASIFGAESAIGKAALVAKQVLNAKELLMDAGKTLGFIQLKSAESGVAIASGAAKTASVGFPQNIPLLIGYAAQAAGIFSAIKSAVKAAKGSTSTPSGLSPSVSAPLTPQASATNLTASSIQGIGNAATGGTSRAYVLDSDIKDNEERNARINRAARII